MKALVAISESYEDQQSPTYPAFSSSPQFLTAARSSSVHKRTHGNPRGDVANQKVRLSNLIAENTVACLLMGRTMQNPYDLL